MFLAFLALAAALPASAARYESERQGSAIRWQPWSRTALESAQKSDRPLFLSIGYAASWDAGRMHREALADADVAEILNTWFAPVVIDRIEHPREAEALEAVGRSLGVDGELPLHLIMTPRLEPIAAVGYATAAELQPMLVLVANQWAHERDGLTARAAASLDAARKAGEKHSPLEVDAATIEKVVDAIAATYDSDHVAFGGVPRKARPMTLSFLMRYAARTKHEKIGELALTALRRLAAIPLRDQLGGGFHRATRDAGGLEPYFEKMLADQALLGSLYLEAWLQTGDPDFEHVARTTFDAVVRDLQKSRGMFDTSQDAFSFVPEGRPVMAEGAFYRWKVAEIKHLVGDEAAGKIVRVFAMKDEEANLPRLAEERFLAETYGPLAEPLAKLLEVRLKRPAPFRDLPVAGENGLMISALARGAAILGERRWLESASWAAIAVRRSLWNEKSKTLRRTEAGSAATASDYAFLVQGMLDLFEASHDLRWLVFALDLQKRQDALFWNPSRGRYDDESLLPAAIRGLRTEVDDELPSANAVAVSNLIRLAALSGNGAWRQRPAVILRSFGGRLAGDGARLAHLAEAYELSRVAPRLAVVTGDSRDAITWELIGQLHRKPEPLRATIFLPETGRVRAQLLSLVPVLAAVETDPELPSLWSCDAEGCRLEYRPAPAE